MPHRQLIYKEESADLRRKYPRWFEGALIAALFITTSLFFAFQKFESQTGVEKKIDTVLDFVDIPPTKQFDPPPKPEIPKIPVASEEVDDIPENIEIISTFDFPETLDAGTPPPADEEPIVDFFALSKKPEVKTQIAPLYPELAKKAGIEGRVTVKVLVDIKGNVEKVEVTESHPLLDQAAIEAAWQFKFSPGMQRDKAVRVWVSIPFHFRLK